MKKVHQIYGKSAIKVACGRKIVDDLLISFPGKKVTCSVCNKIERSRRENDKIKR